MKKSIVITILCAVAFFAQGQENKEHARLAVKVTPVTIFRNMLFTAHAEFAVSPTTTLAVGISPNLVPKSNILDELSGEVDGYNYSIDLSKQRAGYSIDPEIRWYSDKAMDGFFFGLYSSFRFSGQEFTESKASASYNPVFTGGTIKMITNVLVVGPQFGWEKLLGKRDRFVFDGYLGIGGKFTRRNYYEAQLLGPGYDDSTRMGLGLRGNVSLGYRIR